MSLAKLLPVYTHFGNPEMKFVKLTDLHIFFIFSQTNIDMFIKNEGLIVNFNVVSINNVNFVPLNVACLLTRSQLRISDAPVICGYVKPGITIS